MKISLICATSANNVIGVENKLPWKLPADLRHFKELTQNHTIIMGRKTYESVGKPLPNRENIIVTQQENYRPRGCQVVHSVEEALEKCRESGEREVFVIGGASIYRQALPQADRIYLTRIHKNFPGDTFFQFNQADWKETSRQPFPADAANPYPYSFFTYERR